MVEHSGKVRLQTEADARPGGRTVGSVYYSEIGAIWQALKIQGATKLIMTARVEGR